MRLVGSSLSRESGIRIPRRINDDEALCDGNLDEEEKKKKIISDSHNDLNYE